MDRPIRNWFRGPIGHDIQQAMKQALSQLKISPALFFMNAESAYVKCIYWLEYTPIEEGTTSA